MLLLLFFSCRVVSDSFSTPWTVACLSSLSMGFPRQECWSRLPFPLPGELPDCLLGWQVDSLLLSHLGSPPYLITTFSSVQSLSRVRLFATPWIVAYQAPLSMGFPRQEYWSGLRFPSPDGTSVSCIGRWMLYHCATWDIFLM